MTFWKELLTVHILGVEYQLDWLDILGISTIGAIVVVGALLMVRK